MIRAHDDVPDATRLHPAAQSAAVLMGAQALVLLAAVGYLGYQALTGETDSVAQTLMEGLMVLVFAVAVAGLAAGFHRGRAVVRTPTLVWNVLLVPVAISMLGAGTVGLGLLVLLWAVATAAAAVLTPAPDRDVSR